MLISSKKAQYLIPESSTNPDAESWEYYLVWIGVDGGVYCWLFKDFILRQNVDAEIINKTANISNIFRASEREIELTAEDLNENEFDVISKITRALIVRRYFRDGTYKGLAILTRDVEKPKSQNRYNFTILVQEVNDSIMR